MGAEFDFDISEDVARLGGGKLGASAARERATAHYRNSELDGRANTSVDKVGQLRQLRDKHRKIIRLNFQGLSNKEVAAAVGCSEVNVSQILNSVLAKELGRVMQDEADFALIEARQEMALAAPKAVAEYIRLLEEDPTTGSLTPMQRVSVAGSLLDRVGLGKETKITSHNTTRYLTAEDLEHLRTGFDPKAVVIDVEDTSDDN